MAFCELIGHAGMFDRQRLTVEAARGIGLGRKLYRYEEAIFFRDEHPGIRRGTQGDLREQHVAGGVEVSEHDGVQVAVDGIGLLLAAGGDVEFELASGGVGCGGEADGFAADDSVELGGDEIESGVDLLRVREGVAEFCSRSSCRLR